MASLFGRDNTTLQPQFSRLKLELMEEITKLRGEVTFDALIQPQLASLKMELVEEIANLRGELESIKGAQATERAEVLASENSLSFEMSEIKLDLMGEIKKLRDETSDVIRSSASELAVAQISDNTIEDLHKFPIQKLEESVWDAVLVIGMHGITVTQTCLLLLGIALNALLQIGCIFILARHLVTNPYDEEMLENLRKWKACQYTSDTAEPLAPNSGCISIRLDVESIWNEVSDFFTKEESYPAGWVMSLASASAWVFAVSAELRSIGQFALSLWCVPRGSCTRIIAHEGNFVLKEITRGRIWVVLTVAAMRLGIAGNLLHWGMLNLVYTTCIEELMLNACALAFILDIDSFVFAVVTPVTISRIVCLLEPLPLPKAFNLAIAPSLLLLILLAYVLVIDLYYLRPFVHSMEEIIEIIDF